MTNCPYCGGEIPSKDFAVKTPGGNYWHMPCSDKALDEWVQLKEINEKLSDDLVKMIEKCAPEHEELQGYRETYDLQRDSIQQLSAQVVELREMLAKTLPIIGELAESIGYGYYKPEDPRDFTPDFECCSKTEISNWKNDCVKAESGEEIGDIRAWGMGTYKIKNPGMIELRDKMKTILSQPDPGAEIMERMKKLEAVAEALCNYRKFASVYCDQQENIAWQKVEKALAALAGDAPC